MAPGNDEDYASSGSYVVWNPTESGGERKRRNKNGNRRRRLRARETALGFQLRARWVCKRAAPTPVYQGEFRPGVFPEVWMQHPATVRRSHKASKGAGGQRQSGRRRRESDVKGSNTNMCQQITQFGEADLMGEPSKAPERASGDRECPRGVGAKLCRAAQLRGKAGGRTTTHLPWKEKKEKEWYGRGIE
ncbi:hypothetical protein B0H16DRAFT_1477991 [Mycena metata]|uniref:Uncharacterized protein n=1 Tax=Mycena metata TaxID=1033252 RepID=A0AAD7H893_9AGAR|nr:hypothetical protein B0H16DRAFT_1477991 [Mycena metata]